MSTLPRAKVLLFGTFDRLHPGHEFVLTEAMKRGDVIVIIARDMNVKKIKGKPAVQSESERRAALIKKFPTVEALLGDPDDFLRPVRTLDPDLILLGYDQKLPPGIAMEDLPCAIERLPSFHPEVHKSSLNRPFKKG